MQLYLDKLRSNLEASIRAKQAFLAADDRQAIFASAVERLVECYKQGGRLYLAGNGGSAADAQHIAAEFVVKMGRPRASMPAEALTTDSSTMTAIGNDFGYDEVFSRQLSGKASSKDMFLGISTSGKSPNILRALEQCRASGVTSIVFAGWDGGPAKSLADFCIIAPGEHTSAIQETHIVMGHTLCECVEAALYPR